MGRAEGSQVPVCVTLGKRTRPHIARKFSGAGVGAGASQKGSPTAKLNARRVYLINHVLSSTGSQYLLIVVLQGPTRTHTPHNHWEDTPTDRNVYTSMTKGMSYNELTAACPHLSTIFPTGKLPKGPSTVERINPRGGANHSRG